MSNFKKGDTVYLRPGCYFSGLCHGHRLTVSTKNSICLESGVEFGLHLSVLDVEDNKPLEVKTYTNDVCRKDRESDIYSTNTNLTDNQITNTLLTDKMIKVKKMNIYDKTVCTGSILSLNFKEKAFKKAFGTIEQLRHAVFLSMQRVAILYCARMTSFLT